MTTEKFNFSQVLREVDRRNESSKTMSGNNNGQFFGQSKKGQYTPKAPRTKHTYKAW